MRHIFQKTFGGLSPAYYFGHLVFGLFISGVLVYFKSDYSFMLLLVLNTLLYPYSCFVYEGIIIEGNNNLLIVKAVHLLFMALFKMITFDNITASLLLMKFFTMLICFGFAIFIAPIGLLYLYYYHSR